MKRVLLAVMLSAMSAWAGPKKKKPVPSVKSVELTKALDAVQPDAGNCVVGVLGGTNAWTAVVKVKLVLDAQGHIVGLQTTATPEGAEKAAPCIEAVLKKASWPATHAPLTTVEREWTFSMQ